jgi:hypothetical protein
MAVGVGNVCRAVTAGVDKAGDTLVSLVGARSNHLCTARSQYRVSKVQLMLWMPLTPLSTLVFL